MKRTLITVFLTVLLLASTMSAIFAAQSDGRQCNKRNFDGESTGCVDNQITNYCLYMTCGWAWKDEDCDNDHQCISAVVHSYSELEGEPCSVELDGSPDEVKSACCTSAG